MVKNNQIKKIMIHTLVSEGIKHYEAHIMTKDDKKLALPIADADVFVKNLDRAMEQYAAQGVRFPHGEKIDIE